MALIAPPLNRAQGKVYASFAAAEATYGTAAAIDRLIEDVDIAPIVSNSENSSSSRQLGREGTADLSELHAWTEFSMTFPYLKPDLLMWLFAATLGSPTSADLDTGGPYSHDFVHDDDDYAIPAFTVEEFHKSGIQNVIVGCMASRLEWSMARSGDNRLWSATLNVIGKKVATGASGSGTATAEVVEAHIKKTKYSRALAAEGSLDLGLGADDLDTPTDFSDRLIEASGFIDNQISVENLLAFNDEGEPSRARRNQREFGLTTKMEIADWAEVTLHHARTKRAHEFDWDSDVDAGGAFTDFGFEFVYPSTMALGEPTVTPGDGGFLELEQEWHVHNDATDGPIVVAGYNDTAAYLA